MAHSKQGISLCQRKYYLDLLYNTKLLGSKPVITHAYPSIKLLHDNGHAYHDIPIYKRFISHLLYLTLTRHDIIFITKKLSQFLDKPSSIHFNVAIKVLRCLKQCLAQGLLFPWCSSFYLISFSDDDCAWCIESRISILGQCFFLGKSLISWRKNKVRSSSEAKYCALVAMTCELQWLIYLVLDLNLSCTKLPILYCNNLSVIHITSNHVFHKRTKYLEIDCHLIREKLIVSLLNLSLVSSKDQIVFFPH